jgi:predicted Zn finger-like uncharacterized protein
MIVTCSSCSTRYLVDPAQLGAGGRTVRCAKCGHSWLQSPPADMPQPMESAPPPPSFISGNLPVPARPKKRRLPGLTWFGLCFAVIVAAAVVVQGREAITQQWPYAERLYRAAGFPDETSRVEEQGGGPGSSVTAGG